MSSVLTSLGTGLVGVLLPSLATIIAGFVVALLRKQLTKVGIQIDDAQDAQLKAIVRDAIRAADEAARRKPEMPSAEKRQLALDYIEAKAPAALPLNDLHTALDAGLQTERVTAPRPPLVASNPGTFGRPS